MRKIGLFLLLLWSISVTLRNRVLLEQRMPIYRKFRVGNTVNGFEPIASNLVQSFSPKLCLYCFPFCCEW